jgi:hypothetical protein
MKTYASFFEWHDKGRKELGVVEELLVALNRTAGLRLHSPKEYSPDPPDCICLDGSGKSVAIEVAEVVCREAARLNAQGRAVYRSWQAGELLSQVAHVLNGKDAKTFHGGPYQAIIACLFTDEPALTVTQATAELSGQLFGPFTQLTAAYLLFSYDPGSQTYPVVKLGVRE